MKKTIGAVLVCLLILAIPLPALADAWIGEDFTLTPPEDAVQLSLYTPESDPAWALAGVGDIDGKRKEYQEMGVLVEFVGEAGSVSVMKKESSYAKNAFDLALLDQEELDQVLEDIIQPGDGGQLQVDKSWAQAGGRPFYRVKLDVSPTEENPDSQELHELIYGTFINGYALNFHMFSSEKTITPEQEKMVTGLLDTIEFTRILEKQEVTSRESAGTLAVLGLLLLALALPLAYIPIKSRRDKKKKAQLAQQLSAYHKTHGSNQVEGKLQFANNTDCTKEAIHQFSVYQAYVKNAGQLVVSGLMIAAMLSTAFVLDTVWWMKLAAVAVAGYYVYKIVSMSTAVEKVQTKVYSRGPSQTARYSFYPEAFRISGIQSTSVTPYFQLTDIRRRGQYVYLYYGPDNAYMVDLYGFQQGEPEDFVKFIREKAGR